MASRASVYTNSCKSGNPANAGLPLCLLVEIFPPKTHIAGRYGSAPLVLHAGRSTLVLLFPSLRLWLLRRKIRAQVLPMNQKLFKLSLFLTVCGIKRFFRCQHLAVLSIKRLFRWQLFKPKLIECTLGGPVRFDFLPVLLQKLFGIPGGFVLLKDFPRMCIVEYVPPQDVDLLQPLLCRSHLAGQRTTVGAHLVRCLCQFFIAAAVAGLQI